ncbi:hypothetical protein DFP73DRAFT_529837 [Morchella snyderi]|nr:hypothetical protein DFP73DRAFT_529837 [Morchella snyderi]
MSPPPLSSAKRLKSWAPATQYSSKSLPKEAAKAQRRLSSQTPDHTHISISKSVLNIYQLCIEGQTLDIPSDPFESFRFIRDQTLVSYRAVVCGNSTARDQTLTFGVVVAGPGPAPGANYQVPVGIIKIPNSPSPLRRSGRKPRKLSQPEPHLQPPFHATFMDSPHTGVAYKCEDGFMGDFLNPYDVRSETGRSICWAEGKYLNGQSSFGGVFAKSAV